jgi:hypothetical protein
MVMKEPSFWSEQVRDVPVIKDLVENYTKIKEEVLSFINDSFSLIDYPKWDKAGGISDLYSNYWKVCPISSFGHEYTAQYLTDDQKQLSSI